MQQERAILFPAAAPAAQHRLDEWCPSKVPRERERERERKNEWEDRKRGRRSNKNARNSVAKTTFTEMKCLL